MKVINFVGAPGVGKSTASTGLVHCLKKCHILAEYVPEFAKAQIYGGSPHVLNEQNFVFANQDHQLHMLRGHVAVCVSDSPLVLSALYAPSNYFESFKRLVLDTFGTYDNVNYFIERNPNIGYQQEGRLHTAAESDMIAARAMRLLDSESIPYTKICAGDELPERVFTDLARRGLIEVPLSGQATAVKLMERADEFDRARAGPPLMARRRAALRVATP